VIGFFLLTFVLSWSCFFGAMRLDGAGQSALLLIGTFAPAIVGLGLLVRAQGAGGLAAMRRRFTWPASGRWYVFAITYFGSVKLAAAVAHRLIAGAWPRFGAEAWYVIAVAIVISTPVQAGEEIGWRGYALPRLATRFGLRSASLILGMLWSVWHLPLFFLPGADKFGQSFPVFLLGTTTLSVAITWLYAQTNGSLWMTMLMHSAVNQTVGIVPSAVPGAHDVFALSHSLVAWLTVALMSAAAAFFLMRMPSRAEVGDNVFADPSG
jgi:CAAX protease family protein